MRTLSPVIALGCIALIAVVSEGIAEEQEALTFELPKPFYGGTVVSYWSPQLDTRLYADREPFLAPKGTTVISRGKPVTSSAKPTIGELKQINDGDKEFGKTSLVELPEGKQWVQIDLGTPHAVHAVLLWHFHEGARVYFDVVGQVSDDPEFKTGVMTFYNNDYDNSSDLGKGTDKEYIENSDGRLLDAKGVVGRYVRFYSQGNTAHDFNNYVEIEIWGVQNSEL
ncbi:MAG: hypothetical protein L3K26_01465 [Candidatus Hydrogenedentes bacterium]|nr:hypothetical protein [Candidatus Hydrogenedentota bacterium]